MVDFKVSQAWLSYRQAVLEVERFSRHKGKWANPQDLARATRTLKRTTAALERALS